MYWLIEDIKHIETLCRIKHQVAYVDIIPCSHTLHPIENSVCAIYLRLKDDSKGYIIPVNHSETINFELEEIEKVLNSIGKIYVRDRKEFLHYFPIKHCYQPSPTPHPYIPKLTQAHSYIYNSYPNETNLNIIVPIVKHYEVCEQNYVNFNTTRMNPFYNKAALVFNQLERAGIKIDQTKFEQYYNKEVNEFIHTQYNLNTLTTRPSNAFGGINFSALDKNNGERECFIPRNDIFVEMDISAYHPILLANLLGYTFDSDDIHGSFAKMYNVDYNKAKEITFKQIYGGIWKEYQHLEFFKKVIAYTDGLWDEFQYGGYVECPISGHKFYQKELENMNPQKLLNYVLQNLETANNVCILYEMFKILRGKNTKLVLYVYDSFLFDVDKNEKDVLEKISKLINSKNLNFKIKSGTNYANIK
jgi:hypothetical protein